MARQFEFLAPKMHLTSAKLIQKVVINFFIKTSFKNCGITLTAIFFMAKLCGGKKPGKLMIRRLLSTNKFFKVHTH